MNGREAFEQLGWHWDNQLRARLAGLDDAEYFWEPVPDCWSIRATPSGGFAIDWTWPQPRPAPLTTIAWRMAHLTFGVLGFRTNWHFGDKSMTWATVAVPGSAAEALESLDRSYAEWRAAVVGAPDSFFSVRSNGPPDTRDGEFPFEHVVLHINREMIHHGAEIALLRDLYLRRSDVMSDG